MYKRSVCKTAGNESCMKTHADEPLHANCDTIAVTADKLQAPRHCGGLNRFALRGKEMLTSQGGRPGECVAILCGKEGQPQRCFQAVENSKAQRCPTLSRKKHCMHRITERLTIPNTASTAILIFALGMTMYCSTC